MTIEKKKTEIEKGKMKIAVYGDMISDLQKKKKDVKFDIAILESEVVDLEEDEGSNSPMHDIRDTVWYDVGHSNFEFTVMEVNHSDETYKLKSKNLLKPISLSVSWSEIDY